MIGRSSFRYLPLLSKLLSVSLKQNSKNTQNNFTWYQGVFSTLIIGAKKSRCRHGVRMASQSRFGPERRSHFTSKTAVPAIFVLWPKKLVGHKTDQLCFSDQKTDQPLTRGIFLCVKIGLQTAFFVSQNRVRLQSYTCNAPIGMGTGQWRRCTMYSIIITFVLILLTVCCENATVVAFPQPRLSKGDQTTALTITVSACIRPHCAVLVGIECKAG